MGMGDVHCLCLPPNLRLSGELALIVGKLPPALPAEAFGELTMAVLETWLTDQLSYYPSPNPGL